MKSVAILMERMSEVNPAKSSSLVIMQEAERRGYRVFQFGVNDLTLTNARVFARAREVHFASGRKGSASKKFYQLEEDVLIDLSAMDAVLIRQDPPINMEYMTMTYMLEPLCHHTLVVNHPVSIRNAPEKIFPLVFKDFIPPTVITEDVHAAESLLDMEKDVILKPLYYFGGTDVFHYKASQKRQMIQKFHALKKKYKVPLVVQHFIPEVRTGDKRVLLIDGEIAGYYLRKPPKNSIRANVAAGGTYHKTKLNARDLAICEAIKPIVKQYRLTVCGLDIIGDYLTEINVTSVASFYEINKLYQKNPAVMLWDWIEEHRIQR